MECKRHCYRTRKFSIKGIKVDIDIQLFKNYNQLKVCNTEIYH